MLTSTYRSIRRLNCWTDSVPCTNWIKSTQNGQFMSVCPMHHLQNYRTDVHETW
jgi:hypothetical protein